MLIVCPSCYVGVADFVDPLFDLCFFYSPAIARFAANKYARNHLNFCMAFPTPVETKNQKIASLPQSTSFGDKKEWLTYIYGISPRPIGRSEVGSDVTFQICAKEVIYLAAHSSGWECRSVNEMFNAYNAHAEFGNESSGGYRAV